MSVLVTGAAGFIGYSITKALLGKGRQVIGVDNLNDYYDVSLKQTRLSDLLQRTGFSFDQIDVADKDSINALFRTNPDISEIIHLAAQPGVRYSLVNPYVYTHSNIEGHLVLLEASRNLETLKHFIYASSSSVYGNSTQTPFSTENTTDFPVSLYAATKKSMELLSHAYAELYCIPLTGLRFFTVYGPWGRPDMAYYSFTKKILAGETIPVFNHGKMRRDFTYIDDIVMGILSCMNKPPTEDVVPPHRLYNIGNNKSESLMKFISEIERALGKKAEIDFQPMQAGDVWETSANIDAMKNDFGYKPTTSINVGIPLFVEWYKSFHCI
ncbi:MAG: protein CapI [Magnetovibrio sp.]|nr:protein CapI [Magnetovibrio sp.]|tara:strand:- start:196 stop:1173 length:978 start_codon:yes stop_codon:yes gene_type:complete